MRGETTEAIGRYGYDKLLKDGSFRALEVEVYPLEVTDELSDWKERGERSRTWFPVPDAAGLVAEPELEAILAAFTRPTR